MPTRRGISSDGASGPSRSTASDAYAVVFTTGILAAPTRQTTKEGIERDAAVGYLSRFVVLRELASRLGVGRPAGSPAPRVFVMGFPGTGQLGDTSFLIGDPPYDAMAVHMNTVAGNEVLVLDAARRYPSLRTFGLNPGTVKTSGRTTSARERGSTGWQRR